MARKLVYQMWPIAWRNFSDMTQHLKRIKDMGVDYVWLSPFYPSSRYDHGYDIYDYKAVDSRFGKMRDFNKFVRKAHKLGMRVVIDLVLNHTSIVHPWFTEKPERYCWSESDHPGWKNLFDGRSAWKKDPDCQKYYLHLFSEMQADLNWFPDGKLNQELVDDFKDIINFWLYRHDVDGFRLDCPQAINKDFNSDMLEMNDLLRGEKAVEVINALFTGPSSPIANKGEPPFLMMECFDPTFGDIIEYYSNRTPIDYFLNPLLKSTIKEGETKFYENLEKSVQNPYFMLDLESHDSPRFPSVSGLPTDIIFSSMFESEAKGICLFQGQELGLKNPELSDDDIVNLDTMSAMQLFAGKKIDEVRSFSRANNRVPLPIEQYEVQRRDANSALSHTSLWIASWKYW